MLRVTIVGLSVVLGLFTARPSRAEPWLGAPDPFASAERLDEREELAAHGRASPTFVSLVAFTQTDFTGTRELGAMAVVAFAFDAMAARGRASTAFGDPPPPPAPPATPPPPAPASAASSPKPHSQVLLLTPKLARAAVAAAFRVAGLGADDSAIDTLVERARLSALLPETRLRAMHAAKDEDHTGSATDDTLFYGTTGANLWLEARLTWRLDRLIYAGDEPAFERIRLERQATRGRLASHVLELLVQWQRALLDASDAEPAAPAWNEAWLRTLEAEVALDVATGGWFTGNHALRGRAPAGP